MRLSREELTQAVNISLNSHLAMRQVRAGELSEWKGFSFANAARNAVFSALVAKEGVKGPSPIFEGEMGFFQQVSGPFELDTRSFGWRDGGRFKLVETLVKFFPAEYHSQSAIWAALDLRRAIGRDPAKKIVSVEVDTHEAGYTILGKNPEKWAPKTRETADHSLPYIVGMALLEGKLDLKTYAPRKIGNPRIREFMKRIRVREDRALTATYPSSISNRITVRLDDGRALTKQVDDPKGHPRNPMTTKEIEQKFRRLTKGLLKESQIDRILDFVWTVEKQEDVSPLLESSVVR
jgi:2-methylcitrate dehydratase